MGTPNHRWTPTAGVTVRTLTLAGLLVIAIAAPAAAQRAVVLVRHAEKADQSQDALLSAAGAGPREGAGRPAPRHRRDPHRHDRVPPDAVHRQAAGRRPRHHAGHHPRPRAADARGAGARLRPDAVVLVVGHSNTLPQALAAFGWPNTIDLHDRDYDDVFVLVPRGEGLGPTVVRLKYGRKTS